jgi:hypothetical protein
MSTATIIAAIITAFASAIAGACVGAVTAKKKKIEQKLNEKTERTKALEMGVCALLRAEIIRQHEKYVDKGFCPIYAKEALKRTYAAYHNLDGNDIATKLYKEVLDLPEAPTKNQKTGD